MEKYWQNVSSSFWLTFFGVLMVVFLYVFNFSSLPCGELALKKVSGGIGVLDMQFGYTAEEGVRMIREYGQEGLYIYRNFQLLDMVFPLVYGSFFGGLFWGLLVKKERLHKLAMRFIVALVIVDYVENITLFVSTHFLSDIFPFIFWIASGITLIKGLFSVLNMLVFGIGLTNKFMP